MVWYAAYGSNTHWPRLRRHLGPGTPEPAHRWVWIPHALYFAGYSRRWSGGVAFVELHGDGAPMTLIRAWRLTTAQLAVVAASENGLGTPPELPDPADVPMGGWAALPFALTGDGTGGKYDALLRLPDIDGAPAVTLTTTRTLPRRPPCDAYLRVCRAGLAGGGLGDTGAYLDGAGRR